MKHVPITQKAKTRFTFKDNMDISMNADGTGGAFKSPNKNLEKVAEQLEGAVKAHGEQAKAVRKHIAEMKDMKSPAKKKVHPKVQKSLDEGAKTYDARKYMGHKSKKSPAKMAKESPAKKALVGKQKNLPDHLKAKILAAPGKMKKSAAKMKKGPAKMKYKK